MHVAPPQVLLTGTPLSEAECDALVSRWTALPASEQAACQAAYDEERGVAFFWREALDTSARRRVAGEAPGAEEAWVKEQWAALSPEEREVYLGCGKDPKKALEWFDEHPPGNPDLAFT